MKYRVYISYSPHDSMLAEDLTRRLKDVGLGSISVTDMANAPPDYLRTLIRTQMKSASEVIALLTDHSVNSKWVMYEVGIADSLDLPVTLVVVNEGVEKPLPIVGKKSIRYSDLPGYISSLKKRAEAA